MKIFFPWLLILSLSANAQKMKLVSGSLKGLSSQTSFDIKFTYDSINVGKGVTEKQYVDQLRTRWNEREPAKGDELVNKWYSERQRLYEPAFVKNFEEYGVTKLNDKEAKYTLVLKSKYVEAGWDFGLAGSYAIIAGELWIVPTDNNSKVIAKITFHDSRGTDSNGGDFDMFYRIQSAYEKSGKWLGIYFRKKSKG